MTANLVRVVVDDGRVVWRAGAEFSAANRSINQLRSGETSSLVNGGGGAFTAVYLTTDNRVLVLVSPLM